MSESYKIHDDGLYFATFSVVGWLDVFTRRIYQDILTESIQFCQTKKDLKLYCYCVMPSHTHLIAASENGNLTNILRSMKSFTAMETMNAIRNNPQESRRDWLLNQFEFYGNKSKDAEMQFWKHDNHPFFLHSEKLINQKINYIHQNPVDAGFVNDPRAWRLSSANPESPVKIMEL